MLMYRARQRGEMKLHFPVPVILRQYKASSGRMNLRSSPSSTALSPKIVVDYVFLFFLVSGIYPTLETAFFECL